MKQCLRDNLPIPESIKNAPTLFYGLGIYYGAFFDLCSCRNASFGIGEIPWTATRQYCNELDLDDEQVENMHYFISKMDQEYVRIKSKDK